MLRFILMMFFFNIQSLAATETSSVKVLKPKSSFNTTHNYFIELLQFSLDKSMPEYQKKTVTKLKEETSTEWSNFRLLTKKHVDVVWSGTNINREKELQAIKIPLMKGLLGYRNFIIHKDNVTLMNTIDKKNVKKLLLCQGSQWPDSDILEHNNFNVIRVREYHQMWKMLSQKRCDLFPRSIYESHTELNAVKTTYPNLVLFDQLILHYYFPMYFFVNKKNTQLAAQIEFGLRKAIADGSWDELLAKSPITTHLFPLKKWQTKQVIELENSMLPASTPLKDKSLWLKLH